MKYKNKLEQKKIAKQRVARLFELAGKADSLSLSNRYVTLARKIQTKYKIRMPSEFKRRFCKHCYKYFIPSKTCRVRLQQSKAVYFCFNCEKFTRIPYKPKKIKKARKKAKKR